MNSVARESTTTFDGRASREIDDTHFKFTLIAQFRDPKVAEQIAKATDVNVPTFTGTEPLDGQPMNVYEHTPTDAEGKGFKE